MEDLFNIKDNVVVITGGTGILGRVLAKYLAEQGAKIAILGRNSEVGSAIVDGITKDGGSAIYVKVDVMDEKSVEESCKTVLETYGTVDALLNAAGGNQPGATIRPDQTIFDLKTDDFKNVMAINLVGTLIPTQVYLKPMVEKGKGSIVNFSSMSAFRPLTRVVGYGVAKSGISNFTEYMSVEVAKKFSPEIRVNAIAPGFFLTNQNRTLLTNPDGSYTQRGKDIIHQTPMGRMGKPEEICGTIQYLISDASKFVTGTVAVVDGGFNVFSI